MSGSESPTTGHGPRSICFIAGEASGDAHAAEVIRELRAHAPDLSCFGAGGSKMRDAGMELTIDLTEHAVVGLVEVLQNYFKFRGFFYRMLDFVAERRPDAVVLVDYPAFNLRFVKAVRNRFPGTGYRPRIIYYISPQLWAWAERRVRVLERGVDLLISIFPFEKDWYASRAPRLRVEFVGHPMTERYANRKPEGCHAADRPVVALLPGSREREVRAHWPILRDVVAKIRAKQEASFVVLAASERMRGLITELGAESVEFSAATVETLSRATISITASGTATLECAYFGVPTVVLYTVAWPTYLVGRMLVKVNHLAMPNVLAGETVFPEFIQHHATPEAIANAALALLTDASRRQAMRVKLGEITRSLGEPGASHRAATLILGELQEPG